MRNQLYSGKYISICLLFKRRVLFVICHKKSQPCGPLNSLYTSYSTCWVQWHISEEAFCSFFIQFLEGQILSEYARRNLNLVDADFYFPYWVEWHLRQGRSRPEPRGQALLFSTLTPRAGCLHKIHIRPSVSPPLYLATATN